MGLGLPFAVNLRMDAENRVYSPTPAEPSFRLRALLLSSFKKKKGENREGEREREGGAGKGEKDEDERRASLEVKQRLLS